MPSAKKLRGRQKKASLTPQAVPRMYNMPRSTARASTGFNPVLQVLRLALEPELQNEEDSEDEIWSLDLSDGTNFFPGTLKPSLAHLVHNSSIEDYSIIRVPNFSVTVSSATGVHQCVIFEVEVAGSNPGAVIGKPFEPFWLTDDVMKRVTAMDHRATLYLSNLTNMSPPERESLVSGGLLDVLLQKMKQGFKVDCQTIKENDDLETMTNWMTILFLFDETMDSFACIEPVLKLFMAPMRPAVPEKEYYGTRGNYFGSVAQLFRIASQLVKADSFPRSNDDDSFLEFACGAVFWRLANPEVHPAIDAVVCREGSSFIRDELCHRAQTYKYSRLKFTQELLTIANIRVCSGDRLESYPTEPGSTFCTGLIMLIKESPDAIVIENLLEVLRTFVEFDCVDRDMIRGIVNLADHFRWAESVQKKYTWVCFDILKVALNPLGDHHGSCDRRMSIAVDAGLVDLILKMEMTSKEEGDATKAIVHELERGLSRGSKACQPIARVDMKTLMLLSGIDVDEPCFYRAKDLVESARGLCARTCNCCAASLAVGRIFRCGKCGTVYCSRTCQVCVNRCVCDLYFSMFSISISVQGLEHGRP